jgi:hypothetical protein
MIDAHLLTVDPPVTGATGCKYLQPDDAADDGVGQFNVLIVKCPSFPTRVVGFKYTDTVANWAATQDDCSNVLVSAETN